MTLTVNQDIRLDLLNEKHAVGMFQLIDSNREHLREWMMFIDGIDSIDSVYGFIEESKNYYSKGLEHAFVIFYKGEMVGRIGLNKIDGRNKIGEINYWLSEKYQGKGIVVLSCQRLIDYAFDELQLNRLEIKCGANNQRSIAIPKKLNFIREGIIRQSKRLYNDWLDVKLFSLLKDDYHNKKNTSNNKQDPPNTLPTLIWSALCITDWLEWTYTVSELSMLG